MGVILHMVTILVLYSSVAMVIFSYEFVAEKKSEETCILRGGGLTINPKSTITSK